MNESIKEFLDKAKSENFTSENDMKAFAEKNANVFDCIAPSLGEDLRPQFSLRDINQCKNPEHKGKCYECEFMLDTLTHGKPVFSFGTYDLVCVYKGKE